MERLAEVRQIADSVEKQAVKEAAEMLEKIPEASEAEGSVAIVSEAPAQVIQTSNLPLIIPTPVSPSNDSDLDDVPIGQTSNLPLIIPTPEDPPAFDLPQCDSP